MSFRKVMIAALLIYALISYACVYIVLPDDLESADAAGQGSGGWSAMATNVGKSEDDSLHIDLTIQNETGDWSAMQASTKEPAVLSSNGSNTDCKTVFVSSGGHRLAPGFRMRGYITGTKSEPAVQLIYVECAGAEVAPGSTLSIPYQYVTGQYNYYEQDKNIVVDLLEINLDEVAADLEYPVAEPIEGLIHGSGIEITAINKVILKLTGIERTDTGLLLHWETSNPGEYATYVHVGNPPVIGTDGILYGFYETPDIVSVPITPAAGTAEWTTETAVPQDAQDFYIMLSVETGKARLFANYAIDISDK